MKTALLLMVICCGVSMFVSAGCGKSAESQNTDLKQAMTNPPKPTPDQLAKAMKAYQSMSKPPAQGGAPVPQH